MRASPPRLSESRTKPVDYVASVSLRFPALLADRPLLPCSGVRHSVAHPCRNLQLDRHYSESVRKCGVRVLDALLPGVVERLVHRLVVYDFRAPYAAPPSRTARLCGSRFYRQLIDRHRSLSKGTPFLRTNTQRPSGPNSACRSSSGYVIRSPTVRSPTSRNQTSERLRLTS